MDAKRKGRVTETDLKSWINGIEIRKARARKLTLKSHTVPGCDRTSPSLPPPLPSAHQPWVSLILWQGADEEGLRALGWCPAVLRTQIQLALLHAQARPPTKLGMAFAIVRSF
jgi:hypothetical protein